MISDSIREFYLSLQDPGLFVEKTLLTADKMQDTAARGCAWAWQWIRTLVKLSLISFGAALLLALAFFVCLVTGGTPSWLNLILLILCGVAALAAFGLLTPIVMLAQPVIKAFPGFKDWLKGYPSAVASAAFLMFFAVFSFWKLQMAFSPSTAGGIFFVMLVIGAGSATGWVLLPRASVKAIITSQLFLCFFFLMASAILPRLVPASVRRMRHEESLAAERLEDSISQVVSIDPDQPPEVWFNADGSPRYSFAQDRDGVFRVFHADVEHDPGTGQKTSLVTTVEKRDEIIAQVRHARDGQQRQKAEQAAEREQEAKLDADRRFREKYLDGTLLSAPKRANIVLLVIKDEQSGGNRDIVAQHLSAWLVKANKTPVVGALKPAFYDDGLFDAVWNGDLSVLNRLQLFEDVPRSLLLCSADLSAASPSEIEGFVSVQGSLKLILVTNAGRSGPWVFDAPGAGGDQATASANCVKRLVETLDVDVVFAK
ncbi:MAG: hypothetical protein HYV60_00065 [Planctomycetia bacterium]|nr:hypothetical protein [Planctomycetia bacterium]